METRCCPPSLGHVEFRVSVGYTSGDVIDKSLGDRSKGLSCMNLGGEHREDVESGKMERRTWDRAHEKTHLKRNLRRIPQETKTT